MPEIHPTYKIDRHHLEEVFNKLAAEHYLQIGPVAKDGAILLAPLDSFDELAVGFHEKQGQGSYQLIDKADGSFFNYTLGPQSFKKFLHPPRRKLWSAERKKRSFLIQEGPTPDKMAFWGVRNCDLMAIKILDKIFLDGHITNEWYRLARENLFIIAAGCTQPSQNCFCVSAGHGPKPQHEFDISLIEVQAGQEHYFLAGMGSAKASEMATNLDLDHATPDNEVAAAKIIDKAIDQMHPKPEIQAAEELLKQNLEHVAWDEIANRCLSCGNCTMVCPTCFCTSTEDITDLTGGNTERWLRWDSCFNGDFSYIHGGVIRGSTKSRYRQWMTHKLAHWNDQFGTSGCVGCGRCIAWCPVGIDITEELLKINQSTEKV